MAPQPSGGPSSPTGVRATWVGHSTVLLELGGLRVLTDPLLRRRLGPLRRRRDLPVQHHVEDVDVVLLSHLHHDHADLPSLRRVGHVPIVTDPANLPWLDKHDLVPADASADDLAPPLPRRRGAARARRPRGPADAAPPQRRHRDAAARRRRRRVVRRGHLAAPRHGAAPRAGRCPGRPRPAARRRVGPAAVPRAHGPGRGRRRQRALRGPARHPDPLRHAAPLGLADVDAWSGPPTPVTGSSRCSPTGATPWRTCRRSVARS